jgi:hypothetical protein
MRSAYHLLTYIAGEIWNKKLEKNHLSYRSLYELQDMIRRIAYRSFYTTYCIRISQCLRYDTAYCIRIFLYGVLHTDLSVCKVCSGALHTQFCVPFCCTMSIFGTSCVHLPHPCPLSLPTPPTFTRTHASTHTRRPPPLPDSPYLQPACALSRFFCLNA